MATVCFVCGRPNHRGAVRAAAGSARGGCPQGRLLFERGRSACCGRAALTPGLTSHLRAALGRPLPAPDPGTVPALEAARLLVRPGAGLDRSFLDGLGPGEWAEGGPGDEPQVRARVVAGPQRPAAAVDGTTAATVRLELACRCGGEDRQLRLDVEVPAPVQGVLTFAHPQRGIRLCVNLRTVHQVHECVPAPPKGSCTSASVLLGPRTAAAPRAPSGE